MTILNTTKTMCTAGALWFGLSLAACGQPMDGSTSDAPAPTDRSAEAPEDGEPPRSTGDLELLRDGPALEAHDDLMRRFADGTAGEITLGVFELAPLEDPFERIMARATMLGLPAEAGVEGMDETLVVRDGDLTLSIHLDSGAERLVDHARFHKGADASELRADEEYVAMAREHVARTLPQAAERELNPYKLRRYINASIALDQDEPTTAPYQVAVALNTSIDGMPVIGSGGKVAVHMTPGGEVISHESTVRRSFERIGEVRGDEILSPDEAREQVEQRLRERGVTLDGLVLTRAEFGYLRLGRNSIQNVVAPHYAFVFEPEDGQSDKKRIEDVCALRGSELLDRVEHDRAMERERKQNQRVSADPADER